jgi:hypothetical protein
LHRQDFHLLLATSKFKKKMLARSTHALPEARSTHASIYSYVEFARMTHAKKNARSTRSLPEVLMHVLNKTFAHPYYGNRTMIYDFFSNQTTGEKKWE